MARDPEYMALLNSARWRQLRAVTLSRHPLCEDCERHGRTTLATELHHVIPVESAHSSARKRELCFDLANLRALCHACHRAVHIEMRKGTREQREERARGEAEEYAEIFYSQTRGRIFKTGEGVP